MAAFKPAVADKEPTTSVDDALSDVVRVPLGRLRTGGSPRLSGESEEHVRALGESLSMLPPVLVHRPTMRVIDGTHRLLAAIQQGQVEIAVRFFDGDEDEAYLIAVESNVKHGLPLTLADRIAAAKRVVALRSFWSDRRIAAAVGLSPKTVGGIRRQSHPGVALASPRIGLDGKLRSGLPAQRQRSTPIVPAGLAQADHAPAVEATDWQDPNSSHRSSTTHLNPQSMVAATTPTLLPAATRPTTVAVLGRDPSLRFSEPGRALLRLLEAQTVPAHEWDRLVDVVPPYCVGKVAEIARGCASAWQEFADRLAAKA